MADREWFVVPGMGQYPNSEEAYAAAEGRASSTDREVEVRRCTETVIRRYRREVTVVAEDVPTA